MIVGRGSGHWLGRGLRRVPGYFFRSGTRERVRDPQTGRRYLRVGVHLIKPGGELVALGCHGWARAARSGPSACRFGRGRGGPKPALD